MENIFKSLAALVGYYLLGWALLWFVAVMCGAPMDITEWATGARIATSIFIAPLIGAGFASYIEETYGH